MIGWTNDFEKIIIEYKDKINFLKNIHTKLYEEKYKKHSMLMLSLTILNPFTGIISGIGSILKIEEHYILVGASVLNVITGIILSISKFYKYDETSNDHKNSAIMYSNMENNIQMQLTLSRKERIEQSKYLDYLNNEFSEIYKNSPFVNVENFKKDKYIEKKGEDEDETFFYIEDGILKYELDRFNSKKNN